MNKPFMNQLLTTKASEDAPNVREATRTLRAEVHNLAKTAFHRHLISGYGDSEYPDEYQIVHEGKPRHLPLSRARAFLARLLQRHRVDNG